MERVGVAVDGGGRTPRAADCRPARRKAAERGSRRAYCQFSDGWAGSVARVGLLAKEVWALLSNGVWCEPCGGLLAKVLWALLSDGV